MATKDSCDFCKRDEGLVLFLSRYVIRHSCEEYSGTGLYDYNEKARDFEHILSVKKDYLSSTQGDNYTEEDWKNVDIEKANRHMDIKTHIEILEDRWEATKAKNPDASREEFELEYSDEIEYVYGRTVSNLDDSEQNNNSMHVNIEKSIVKESELKSIYNIDAVNGYAYELASLRKGFVYVYSPHLGSGQLEKYEVSNCGFLINRSLKKEKKATIFLGDDEPCFQTGHRSKAATIVIKKPKEADQIWIKYSEIEWTEVIENKVSNQEFREDNMISIDIQKVFSQIAQRHVTTLSLVSNYILDNKKYFDEAYVGNLSLSKDYLMENPEIGARWHQADLNKISQESLEEMINADEKDKFLNSFTIHANVILTDAVGLLMDIGGKMAHEKSKLIDTNVTNSELTNEEKTLITYNSLNEMLRLAVFDQTLEEADSDNTGFFSSIFQNKKKNLQDLNTEEIEELAKKVNSREIYASYDMWGAIDYKKYFSAKETLKLKEQNVNQTIEELGEWYISLLSNDFILKSLNSNYDDQDIINNVEFTTNTLNIVRNSMLAKCVIEYYKEKLQSKVDDNNIILKAFSMNNKKMMDLVQNQLDLRGLVWGDVLTKTKAFFDEVTKAGKVNGVPLIDVAKGSLDELLSASSPAIIAAQAPKMDSLSVNNGGNVPKNLSPALMIVGGYTNNPSIAIEIKFGSQKDFYKKIAAAMVRAVQNVAPDQIVDKRRLEKEIRKIKFYEQLSLKGTVEFKALFPKYAITRIGGQIDFERLVAASFYKNKTGFVPLFPNDTTFTPIITDTPTAEPRVNANLDITEISEKLGSKTAVSVGTLNGLFQILNFQAVLEAIQNKKLLGVEAFSRMSAAIYGVVTGIAEATIYTISCLVSKKHFFRRWEPLLNKKVLPLVGKIAAAFGMITALFDIYNGIKIGFDGDIVEGFLLASSGGLILYSSFLFFFNATNPIGWILLILGLGLGLAYNIIKKSEFEKWLIKSFLGVRIGSLFYAPYKTYEQQQNALNKILKV